MGGGKEEEKGVLSQSSWSMIETSALSESLYLQEREDEGQKLTTTERYDKVWSCGRTEEVNALHRKTGTALELDTNALGEAVEGEIVRDALLVQKDVRKVKEREGMRETHHSPRIALVPQLNPDLDHLLPPARRRRSVRELRRRPPNRAHRTESPCVAHPDTETTVLVLLSSAIVHVEVEHPSSDSLECFLPLLRGDVALQQALLANGTAIA